MTITDTHLWIVYLLGWAVLFGLYIWLVVPRGK
jgi:hypothetical protein